MAVVRLKPTLLDLSLDEVTGKRYGLETLAAPALSAEQATHGGSLSVGESDRAMFWRNHVDAFRRPSTGDHYVAVDRSA